MMPSHRRTFIKQLGLGAAGLSLTSSLSECVAAGQLLDPKLPRSTPEAQGVSSRGILGFLEALGNSRHEFHSFLLVRHGHVIAEGWWSPYRSELNHMLYSLSKSFTSTAVGFAVAERRLTVEDLVISFFPDELPATVGENLTALRVKHLLTMSVGHAVDSTPKITPERNWVRAFLALPIPQPPGSGFLYNSGASYMLSAIVQKVSGQKVIDFLTPRLFEPLNIRGMSWETCPLGINTGGWGLSIQTEGLAKFGQLYLQKGLWNGNQLLPKAWIEKATTFKIQQPAASGGSNLEELKKNSEWHQGYCYQFWRCRHNAYRADGAFGQYTFVMPDQDAVIAITSETSSMAGEMNLIWDHLLPAMKEAPVPADKASQSELNQKLSSLALLPPKGRASSPVAARVSGRDFQLEDNALGAGAVSFIFQEDSCVFNLNDGKTSHPIACGLGKWVDGQTDMPGTPPKLTSGSLGPISKVAAGGIWKDQNTFEMTWRFHETPHHDTVTCRFDGDRVKITFMNSVTENMPPHPETRPTLLGQMTTPAPK